MIDYTSENHLLFSDSRLEHWLLRYSQNRGGGGGLLRDTAANPIFDWILVAMISQPAMQNQLSFFNAIRR